MHKLFRNILVCALLSEPVSATAGTFTVTAMECTGTQLKTGMGKKEESGPVTLGLKIYRTRDDNRIVWITQTHPSQEHFFPREPGVSQDPNGHVKMFPTNGFLGDWITNPPIDAQGVPVADRWSILKIRKEQCERFSDKPQEKNTSSCAEYSYDALTGTFAGYQENKLGDLLLWSVKVSALCKPMK